MSACIPEVTEIPANLPQTTCIPRDHVPPVKTMEMYESAISR